MTTSLDGSALSAMAQRPLSPEQAAVQKRLFQEAIAPIQKMKAYIYSLYLPTFIFETNGKLLKVAYPEEMRELIARLDDEIERIAASWHRP